MLEAFQESIDLIQMFVKPELVVLIPVLFFIGSAIKKSKVPDAWIPYILGVISILLSLLYLVGCCSIQSWHEAAAMLFTAITQGILTAGGSVYIHQLMKQKQKL